MKPMLGVAQPSLHSRWATASGRTGGPPRRRWVTRRRRPRRSDVDHSDLVLKAGVRRVAKVVGRGGAADDQNELSPGGARSEVGNEGDPR